MDKQERCESSATETWELIHYARPMTINSERRASGHWATRAKMTKEWREAFFILAKAAKIPKLQWIEVEVDHVNRDGRLSDPVACLPSLKAGLDGVVDSGIIPNDTGKYVKKVTFLAPRMVKGEDSLTLRITGPRI